MGDCRLLIADAAPPNVRQGKPGGFERGKSDDIQERLIDFGVRVLKVCASLPRSKAGRHLGDQLLRSGTAPATNYAEARGSESAQDFIHKLRICSKELNESAVWLAMITRAEVLPAHRLEELQAECTSLTKIINASIATAKSNNQRTAREESASYEFDVDN